MHWLRFMVLFKLTVISKKKYFFIKINKKLLILIRKFIQCNLINSVNYISNDFVQIFPNQLFFLFKPKNFKILYKKSRPIKINIKNLTKLKKFKNSNFFLLSTNYGLLTNDEAIKKKTGGFLICKLF